jgi:hypothetical protein
MGKRNPQVRGFHPAGATGLEPATPGFGKRGREVYGAPKPHGCAVEMPSGGLRSGQVGRKSGRKFRRDLVRSAAPASELEEPSHEPALLGLSKVTDLGKAVER